MKKLIITTAILFTTSIFTNMFYGQKNVTVTKNNVNEKKQLEKTKVNKKLTIYLQPLGKVESSYVNFLKNSIYSFYGFNCVIMDKEEFTSDILTKSKTRYDADKILEKFNNNSYKILITEKDIATKKGIYPEWGILGLGFCPGKTCVVSTFRLKRNVTKQVMMERLKKVALHEIGHNLGLEHCDNNIKCMMNDAGGTIKQVDREVVWLCDKCEKQIKHFRNPN